MKSRGYIPRPVWRKLASVCQVAAVEEQGSKPALRKLIRRRTRDALKKLRNSWDPTRQQLKAYVRDQVEYWYRKEMTMDLPADRSPQAQRERGIMSGKVRRATVEERNREIVAMYMGGVTQVEVARHYHLCTGSVALITRGLRRAHHDPKVQRKKGIMSGIARRAMLVMVPLHRFPRKVMRFPRERQGQNA